MKWSLKFTQTGEKPCPDKKITIDDQGQLQVPDKPFVVFIEGDGIGVDITHVMQKVVGCCGRKIL